MFKSHQIKSNRRVLSKKKELDSYGAPVLSTDYGATVLASKMSANSNSHSMFNFYRFLWLRSLSRLTLQARGLDKDPNIISLSLINNP
jgi:hypothetical protein